jgi:hypothetical protein
MSYTKEQLVKAMQLYQKAYADNPDGYTEENLGSIEFAEATIETLIGYIED